MELFWNIFEKSGSIEAYLGYREVQKQRSKETDKKDRVDKENLFHR